MTYERHAGNVKRLVSFNRRSGLETPAKFDGTSVIRPDTLFGTV